MVDKSKAKWAKKAPLEASKSEQKSVAQALPKKTAADRMKTFYGSGPKKKEA